MIRSTAILISAFALCVTAMSASAEIFRYVDGNGEMHFVSDLNDVPPEHRAAALADAKNISGKGTVNIVDGLDDSPPPANAVSDAPAETTPAAEPPSNGEVIDLGEGGSGGNYDDERLRRHRAREHRAESADTDTARPAGEHPSTPANPPGHRVPEHHGGPR